MTRALDAARTTTLACVACLADAILLVRVTDAPSAFAEHYAGRAGGPTSGFALSLGRFGSESASAPFLSPELAAARASALEYEHARRANLAPDPTLFVFDESMRPSTADLGLVQQLCLAGGLPSGAHEVPLPSH